jgi:pimeloyl-ACP methyl ester carboxylesterase
LTKRTIVRSGGWRLIALRAYFAIASHVWPDLARLQAEHLFTTPPRYTGRSGRPVAAGRETVAAGHRSLAVWQVGAPEAQAVLLVHGWGGRGVQMGSFLEPLLAQGFRVIWFDHPGHGESGREAVALPDFVRALEAVSATHGPFAAAIGHSLGGAPIGIALRRGIRFGRVAFVAAPASINEHARNFAL